MYYTILNDRLENRLPTALTSNLNVKPWREGGISLVDVMGSAGVSRLRQMTGDEVYIIEGEDRR